MNIIFNDAISLLLLGLSGCRATEHITCPDFSSEPNKYICTDKDGRMPNHGTIGKPGQGGIRTYYGKQTQVGCQTLCGLRPSGCCESRAGTDPGICNHFVDGVQEYSSGHDDTASVMCAPSPSPSYQDTLKDCNNGCEDEEDPKCYGDCGRTCGNTCQGTLNDCKNGCEEIKGEQLKSMFCARCGPGMQQCMSNCFAGCPTACRVRFATCHNGCAAEQGPARGDCFSSCATTWMGVCMIECHKTEDELVAIERELRGVIKQGGLRLHM